MAEQQDDLPSPEKLKQQIEEERKRHREQELEAWRKEDKKWGEEGKTGRKPRKPSIIKQATPVIDQELNNRNAVPKNWLWLKLQELGEWNGGGTPRRSNAEYWDNGTILWVSPKDMKKKNITETQDLMTEKALENSSAKIVKTSSILFVTRSGILRRTLPVAIAKQDLTINQDLKALTPVKCFLPEYIYWYCKGNEFAIRRECAKDGTTVESIETQALQNYLIPICSQKEQKKIVNEVESKISVVEQLEETIGEELQKAETL